MSDGDPIANRRERAEARLIVEAVQRRTFEIDVFLPYEEAWRRRVELAAPFLNDEAGEPLWTAVGYSAEGIRSVPTGNGDRPGSPPTTPS